MNRRQKESCDESIIINDHSMSFRSFLLLLILFFLILRILNTRSQFGIESRIRISNGEKNPPCPPYTNHAFPARSPTKERKKKHERNEETIGDILAAEAARRPGRPEHCCKSRSGKSREINFPMTRLP